MKRLLFLALPLLFIFSCKNAENPPTVVPPVIETIAEIPKPQKVTITGIIENPVGTDAEIRGDGIEDMKGLNVNLVDGKFNMEFFLREPTNLSFRHGQETANLYLKPGDEVTLTLNPKQFDETIRLSGKGAAESNYLFKKYLLRESQGEMKDIFSLSSSEFSAKIDLMKKENIENLKNYTKDHPEISPDFVTSESKSNEYAWAMNKMNYPGYFTYFTNQAAPDLGDDYLSFLNDFDFNDQRAYKNNRNYSVLVRNYMSNEAMDLEDSVEKLTVQFKKINTHVSNQYIKNELLFEILNNEILYGKTEGIQKFVDLYNNETTNNENKKVIAEAYKKANFLTKGVEAPTFAYADTKDKIVDLKDMRGKNVYIDVWATWCGPCKAEIPSLKELEYKYLGNPNIAFMSVSIDKMEDKQKWLKMIGDKKLGGTQLLADRDWRSSICKDYMIEGIPRFILIDKEGKIIDKNAPRPSSPQIKEILADLAKPTQTSVN